MDKFGKSQPVVRVEDVRFLTGQGRYLDDAAPAGALFGFVVRSTMAHADIAALDVDAARAAPGVALVLTAADLLAAGVTLGMSGARVTNRDGSKGAGPERPVLATDRVRHVGEAVAFIVADSIEAAKDAAELVDLDLEPRAAHVALAPGGEELHAGVAGNRAFDFGLGDRDRTEAALAQAAHVVTLDVADNRVMCASMETRGCWAEMEGGRLHVALGSQGVWGPKREIARQLGMDAGDVRVTTPDVGGGFGMKGLHYPETILVAHAARVLGRPVRWMSERTEAMLSDTGGRDLVTTAALGFDGDHRLIAYRLETVANLGAYNSMFAQFIQTELFSKVLTGVYDVQAAWMGVTGVYTNTTPVDAYRGAGRPEAIFVLERAMDFAARQMGVDPWGLREKNFIRPEQFPYATVGKVIYDVGAFSRVLARAAQTADVAGFAARRAASAARRRLRGQGLCYYIESILGAPTETAKVVFRSDGGVDIHVGTQSTGQGHETVFAQFLADQTGIPADRIRVRQGDSDLIATGGGTGGSRSVTVQNTATLATVERIVAAFAGFLAAEQGVDPADVTFDDERFRVAGSNVAPTMLDLAGAIRVAGQEELLQHSATITLDNRSFPNGAHVAEVEIDPETGVVRVEKYTVVDDFGNLINPMLAEGQVHGGVAQGLGQALSERVVFDAEGQLLSATFMDYAMPRADTIPWIAFHSEPVPSTYNPMGMKGCGEAGTVGALAAITNAVQDAVWDRGLRDLSMPFTPHRVWEMLRQSEEDATGAAA